MLLWCVSPFYICQLIGSPVPCSRRKGLAFAYANGAGFPAPHLSKAAKWMRRAAEQDDLEAVSWDAMGMGISQNITQNRIVQQN